jgi:hypothetical protein
MDINVEIQHIWTKERKSFKCENITRKSVDIYWPLSGSYIINLSSGSIMARSIPARLRYKSYINWTVVDIEKLRKDVHEFFNPKAEQKFEQSIQRHNASMPKKVMIMEEYKAYKKNS